MLKGLLQKRIQLQRLRLKELLEKSRKKISPAEHEEAAAWHFAAANAHDRKSDTEDVNRHEAASEKHLSFAYKHLEAAGHPEGVVPENVKTASGKYHIDAPTFVHHDSDKLLKSEAPLTVACAWCKKVRTKDVWASPKEAPKGDISHGICPDCEAAAFPEEPIKKEMWHESEEDKAKIRPLHGWISPKGEFHQMEDSETHHGAANKAYNYESGGRERRYDEGWISSGHAAMAAVSGRREVLEDPSHPATKKLSEMVRAAHPSIEEIEVHPSNGPANTPIHRVPRRHAENGNFKKPSTTQMFRSVKEKLEMLKAACGNVKKYSDIATDAIPLTPTREEVARRKKIKAKSIARNLTMRTNVEYPSWIKTLDKPLIKRKLDPAEGVKITHIWEPGKTTRWLHVQAHKDGKQIGAAQFHEPSDSGDIHPFNVSTHEDHRRKGIASAMYAHAEKVTGKKIVSTGARTQLGDKLWEGQAKQKLFGKSSIMEKEGLEENLSHRSRMHNDVIAEVDPVKFDAVWSKDKDFHVGPGGKGGIGNRYENVKRLITEGKKLPLPEVSIRENGGVGFVDGRHRFAVQRDMGHKKIHVAIDKDSVKHIRPEHGIKIL